LRPLRIGRDPCELGDVRAEGVLFEVPLPRSSAALHWLPRWGGEYFGMKRFLKLADVVVRDTTGVHLATPAGPTRVSPESSFVNGQNLIAVSSFQ